MNIYKYLPILLFAFITSCTEKPSTIKQPEKAESTGEIVNTYVNTLTTAQDKAKKVAGAVSTRIGEENKAAQEMEKQ